jgi:hypothetical protein
MTNTLTATDIANNALDHVGGLNIQSIDDNTNPNAQLCNRHYAQCVRAELDKFEWFFAYKVQKALPVDIEAHPEVEIKGYIAYHLPADFSRLSQFFFSAYYPYRKNQYELGHSYFLTSDYLYTRFPIDEIPYTSNHVEISKWPQLFCDVVAAALAVRIARKVMGTDADIAFLNQIYNKEVSAARRQQLLQMEPSATGTSETQDSRLRYYGGF